MGPIPTNIKKTNTPIQDVKNRVNTKSFFSYEEFDNASYYVFKWIDSDSDDFVDLDEINTTPVVSG